MLRALLIGSSSLAVLILAIIGLMSLGVFEEVEREAPAPIAAPRAETPFQQPVEAPSALPVQVPPAPEPVAADPAPRPAVPTAPTAEKEEDDDGVLRIAPSQPFSGGATIGPSDHGTITRED